MLLALDWKRFRIPQREREAVTERYYIAQLLKRVHNESSVIQAIHATNRMKRDLGSFYNEGGPLEDKRDVLIPASDAGGVLLRQTRQDQPWHLSEETILDLIALSAKALSGCEPFRNHPSLVAGKSDSSQTALLRTEVDQRKTYACLMLRQQDTSPAAQQQAGQSSGQSDAASIEAEAPQAMAIWARSADLEELLQRFTPRLCFEDPSATSPSSLMGD